MTDKILLFFSGRKTVQKNIPIPLSILAIAGPVIEAGYRVDIIDSRVDSFDNLDLSPYSVIGISSVTGRNMAPAIQFAKKVRLEAPRIPIVWGGIHVSALPEQSLGSDLVDVVVLREGDETFLDLVQKIINGSRDYSDVKGLALRKNGATINTGPRGFIDVEKTKRIPYNLLNPHIYGFKDHMTYISSRGCPHNCAFCYNKRHNQSNWRPFGAERVLEDLNWMIKHYSPRGISFSDDNFFVSKERVASICEGIIKLNLKFTWGASCRSDYFTKYEKDFIDLMVRSGLKSINLGFESGSDRMLDKWCGNKRVENHYIAMEKIKDYPVECNTSFMMGYPGETDQDLEETFKMIEDLKKINPKFKVSWMNIIFPFPDTDLYDRFKEFGFVAPKTLEQWSQITLHSRDITSCHPEGRMKKLDNIHKLSVWCYLGDPIKIREIWKKSNGRGRLAHLLANVSSNLRFRTGCFGFPIDINYLHKRHLASVDFDMPD